MPFFLRNKPIFTITWARDGTLWSGVPHGLYRFDVESKNLSTPPADQSDLVPTALFQDREGDLWIGSSEGLQRWREGVFVTYSSAQGFPHGSTGPVFAVLDRAGNLADLVVPPPRSVGRGARSVVGFPVSYKAALKATSTALRRTASRTDADRAGFT